MRFNSENNEKARGLIFHITPSNIPTNFAYSLLFGLLNGNANIVKVSSKEFEQVKIFSNALKLLVKKKKFEIFKKMIKIVRYENNEKFTQEISLKSDARLIWGSDQTIEKIKSFSSNKEYYIYCKSGARSSAACKIMNQMGFNNVYNLLGGISEWNGEIVN